MRTPCLPFALLLAVVAFASPAKAFEKQQHIAVQAGPSLLVVSGTEQSSTNIGAALGATYTYGVSDMFNLHASVTGSLFSAGANAADKKPLPRQPLLLAGAHVGGSYLIDVLRWVPYVGADVGATAFAGHDFAAPRFFPSARAFAGLDYQLDRHLAIGGLARQEFFVTKMSNYSSRTELLFKFEYAWGY